jgi:hypothetical protein
VTIAYRDLRDCLLLDAQDLDEASHFSKLIVNSLQD